MAELGKRDQGKNEFAVWGGKLNPDEWHAFLSAWAKPWPAGEMRWGIWEFVSDFYLNKGQHPAADRIALLERAELFDESGHLSTRRDGETVYWHFVGKPSISAPKGYEDAESYWQKHANDTFRCQCKRMLLWGERIKSTDNWFDDRLAWAELSYPHVKIDKTKLKAKLPQRAVAKYREFTRAGQVAFVWLTELTNY